ncbi:hypothetical protein RIR_jg15017.t1 [Rhizophagus irregularis DAOM 181602=DAOM 197198]|nr:hypothetical protein RIR_jg15017.t1 [Rhizophagus irregularis DAOM 181602=DAOM 197198]CAG8587104.1 6943_t:CDS:2 [Rhizophagus irregularis]
MTTILFENIFLHLTQLLHDWKEKQIVIVLWRLANGKLYCLDLECNRIAWPRGASLATIMQGFEQALERSFKTGLAALEVCILETILSQIRPFSLGLLVRIGVGESESEVACSGENYHNKQKKNP